MKELSMKKEVLKKTMGESKDLKTKERNLVKELLGKKKETSVQAKLNKEVRQFESLKRKDTSDYSLFLIKLQSIKDQLEYQRDTSDGDKAKIEKDIGKVEKLIDKYKKEQFDACMQRSDEVLDRVQKVLRF